MPVNLNLQPTGSQLRQFGLIAFSVFTVLGSVVAWHGGPFGLSFGSATWPVVYALWALINRLRADPVGIYGYAFGLDGRPRAAAGT